MKRDRWARPCLDVHLPQRLRTGVGCMRRAWISTALAVSEEDLERLLLLVPHVTEELDLLGFLPAPVILPRPPQTAGSRARRSCGAARSAMLTSCEDAAAEACARPNSMVDKWALGHQVAKHPSKPKYMGQVLMQKHFLDALSLQSRRPSPKALRTTTLPWL